jgi:hypothetical protein
MTIIPQFFTTDVNLLSVTDYTVSNKFLTLSNDAITTKLNNASYIELLSTAYMIGFPSCNINTFRINNCSNLYQLNLNKANINTLEIKNTNFQFLTSANYPTSINNISITNCTIKNYTLPLTLLSNASSIQINTSLVENLYFANKPTILNNTSVLSSYLTEIATYGSFTPNTNLKEFSIKNCSINKDTLRNILKYFIANKWLYVKQASTTTLPTVVNKLYFTNLSGVNTNELLDWFATLYNNAAVPVQLSNFIPANADKNKLTYIVYL